MQWCQRYYAIQPATLCHINPARRLGHCAAMYQSMPDDIRLISAQVLYQCSKGGTLIMQPAAPYVRVIEIPSCAICTK
jgi:hypothetical protein